jgi:hypothetical protein
VIVWSLFEHGYKQCSDTPIGTYVTAVPNFVQGYINQKAQDAYDQGQDFEYPDVSQFIPCTQYQINNNYYYLQFGCSDETTQAITIKIFDDAACTKRSEGDNSALDYFDISSVQVRQTVEYVVVFPFYPLSTTNKTLNLFTLLKADL